ncbi:hypothetical protein RJ640_025397 [Escallonia rubra]|uniref:ER lumen protein retaining receptor n=1 Tax=Escallonia rubra TaxID=112253 RepID=A0AA88RT89_9ASTE|nr:hypothetical protein RJ640_025397 [Escallonia rubra]
MGRRRGSPVNKLFAWVRRQSMKVKTFLAVTSVLCSLVALKLMIKDRNHFYVASESIHAAGIMVLIYKLTTQKTCSGLSLKTQELTAIFLAVRLYCSFVMEADIHTVLDFATLVSTLWVIYMIRFKLKSSYISELDNMPIYYLSLAICSNPDTVSAALCIEYNFVPLSAAGPTVPHTALVTPTFFILLHKGRSSKVSSSPDLFIPPWSFLSLASIYFSVQRTGTVVPSAILALLIHPYTQHSHISRILWAFCVYLESVSVLPQLRLMQNAKMIEPFTAHYVFALGVARFLGCAHWIIQVYDTAGTYLFLLGSGYLWLPMVLLSEIVQTFILADFCYYYIKRSPLTSPLCFFFFLFQFFSSFCIWGLDKRKWGCERLQFTAGYNQGAII